MASHTVTVWLSPGAFGLPGPPMQAVRFDVTAESELAACDVAFAVCNSYPSEMFCDHSYSDVVDEYRSRKHRSLSVGDYVQVGHRWHRCDHIGWESCPPPEGI
jgi:hypothetical protein